MPRRNDGSTGVVEYASRLLDHVSAAQTNGIQAFDQVQICAGLLDLLAKVGGAASGCFKMPWCFSEATLFL